MILYDFLQKLTGKGGQVRLSVDDAWRVFHDLYPKLSISTDVRTRLAALLEELAKQGKIRLPVGKGGWDRASKPPPALWLEILREKAATNAIGMDGVAWPPELAFAAKLKSRVHLPVLLCVRDWLASGGRRANKVPMKERSAEIFGDEKRLDKLLKTDLFAQGALTIEVLRCYPVYPELIWKRGSITAPDILIIENSNTYHSFCQWNAKSKQNAACVYGNGFMIHHFCQGLTKVRLETNPTAGIQYFGDLDFAGIRIPTELCRIASQNGLPEVLPAEKWCGVLLDQFQVALPNLRKASPGAWTEKSLEWFSSSLRARIATIFKQGYRAPQELVDTGWFSIHNLSDHD